MLLRNIIAEFKKISKSKVKIGVTIEFEKIEEYKDMALRHIGSQMQVGGFRKGKAPLHILKEQVDNEKFLIEVVDTAISQSYYEVLQENKDNFLPIGSPKIDFTEKIEWSSLEKDFKYTAEVDVYPDIELADYTKIKIEKKKIEIKPDEVQKLLDELRQKRSTLLDVDNDYSAKKGDWLDVDFNVLLDGEIISDASTQHFPLVLGKNSMIAGFEDQLVDLKKTDKKIFELDIPIEFRDKRLAGKKVKFDVTINDIKTISLPDLNDEFAKSLHMKDVDALEDLKKQLENNLRKEKDQKSITERHNEIIEKITEKSKLELPESLIERELHAMWHEFEENMKNKGIDPQDYIKKEGLDREKILNGWRDQAEKRVKIGLIVAELIKKEKVVVEEKEIDEEIDNELKYIKTSLENEPKENNIKKIYKQYVEYYKKIDVRDKFRENILIKKLFTILDNIILG